uniref:Uncharacterized protein n=1 Tax=Rhizophora mucronata TaxID=61149 RepID=A0A2P2Q4V9_RHIMU
MLAKASDYNIYDKPFVFERFGGSMMFKIRILLPHKVDLELLSCVCIVCLGDLCVLLPNFGF